MSQKNGCFSTSGRAFDFKNPSSIYYENFVKFNGTSFTGNVGQGNSFSVNVATFRVIENICYFQETF